MKGLRLLTAFSLLLVFKLTDAQTFEKQDSLQLLNLTAPQLLWADFNKDDYYDLLVYGKKTGSDSTLIYLAENKEGTEFELHKLPFFNFDIRSLQTLDVNHDGLPDILFSGIQNGTDTLFTSFLNQDELQFELADSPLDSILTSEFVIHDFNGDNQRELLYINSEGKTKFLLGTNNGWVEEENEINDALANRILILDTDSDGLEDIFISSSNRPDSLTRYFRNNSTAEWADTEESFPLDTMAIDVFTHGAYTLDQYPDFFISGTTQNLQPKNVLVAQKDQGFQLTEILPQLTVLDALMADFDSDGTTDLWLNTTDGEGANAYYFLQNLLDPQDTIVMESTAVIATQFADYSNDGNLDFAQLVPDGTSLKIIFYTNTKPYENAGPSSPPGQNVVQTGPGQGWLVWQTAGDSLTNGLLISYDAQLRNGENETLNDGNIGGARNSAHGNKLYAHEYTFNQLAPGNYFYNVFAADNAFNYFGKGGGGSSEGDPTGENPYRFAICEATDITSTSIEVCEGSTVEFGTQGIQRNWVSEKRGSLGKTDLLDYTVEGDDILYGTVIQFSNCSEGQLIYNVHSFESPVPEVDIPEFLLICPGDEASFSVGEDWQNISWQSDKLGDLGDLPQLIFTPLENQMVTFTGENEEGCTFTYISYIDVDDFVPAVKDSVVEINISESVELMAEGGAEYHWQPSSGLNNPDIANPIASPSSNTLYTVTITSEYGCSEIKEVQVNVIQMGGVANLFTPNGDGKNDNIVVFLSQKPSDFEFSIFNRSGSKVYHTNDPQEAMQQGWDGTVNGALVASGVYFWKVTGRFENGQEVKLNGERSGKISLVR